MPEIKEVLFPPDVVDKLWQAHRLTQWEVEQVVFDPESEPRWDIDPIHGGRVIVRGHTSSQHPKLLFVALEPIDIGNGVWACITAFAPTNERYGEREEPQ